MNKNKKINLKKPLFEKFPNSKGIKKSLRYGYSNTDKKKVVVCDHNKIDYKTLSRLAIKQINIIQSLASQLNKMEDRLERFEQFMKGGNQ